MKDDVRAHGRRRSGETARALVAATANLLVLPGLGSLIGGRFLEGLAQSALALAGFWMTGAWLLDVVSRVQRAGTLLLDPPPAIGAAFLGLGVFGVAWLWSAATSWVLLRRARAALPLPGE